MKDTIQALRWADGELWILDQRRLPGRVEWIRARTAETVARAIETLAVRGAPVIGIAAAYGVALAARSHSTPKKLESAIYRLSRTRPTGRNLFETLEKIEVLVQRGGDDLARRLERKAIQLHRNDARSCLAMARHGFALLERGECVLTYCNTGALATGGIGTALGVIKNGYRRGRVSEVFACETRPVLQGARLTVWECAKTGIPATLICDNMAGALMRSGKITRVLVGADRIARNGDTSNKIGTSGLAMMARECRIPFHVVAPVSTFDTRIRSGREIVIEERDHREVLSLVAGLDRIKNVRVWNPAFDVTPARYVTSFITDRGVLHPPFDFR
ncbi:S-methyl-5-thioribose-1-phosphate isomerase [candidate division KSB1 bacterium]|nr:MAG: S-methyl-5-thioribose-1-phosphate isomerase [candidate division KSB1 bacterium]